MDQFQEDANALIAQVEELNTRLQKYREEITDLLKEIDKQQMILSHFDDILKSWATVIETQSMILNTAQQHKLINSIEVIGLPEQYGHDIEGVASILSQLLHIRIDESFITGFARIGEASNIDVQNGTANPRTLAVHLIDHNIKTRILTVADMVMLHIPGFDTPMYITEHLTPMNHELLKKARQEALKNHINYVWVKNGKIYVRRSDVSLIYEIKCDSDIKNMVRF